MVINCLCFGMKFCAWFRIHLIMALNLFQQSAEFLSLACFTFIFIFINISIFPIEMKRIQHVAHMFVRTYDHARCCMSSFLTCFYFSLSGRITFSCNFFFYFFFLRLLFRNHLKKFLRCIATDAHRFANNYALSWFLCKTFFFSLFFYVSFVGLVLLYFEPIKRKTSALMCTFFFFRQSSNQYVIINIIIRSLSSCVIATIAIWIVTDGVCVTEKIHSQRWLYVGVEKVSLMTSIHEAETDYLNCYESWHSSDQWKWVIQSHLLYDYWHYRSEIARVIMI